MTKKTLHVAVGILIDSQKNILVALREKDSGQGGLWEFPGGKIESQETPYEGLCRELKEEIGIKVSQASTLLELFHDYPAYAVQLYVWQVHTFEGEPHGAEGQIVEWVDIYRLKQLRLPGANGQIVEYLEKTYLLP